MTAKENRELKSSVFTGLFYADETAEANDISLYNALHEKTLPEEAKIEKIKVNDVIYMNFQMSKRRGISIVRCIHDKRR